MPSKYEYAPLHEQDDDYDEHLRSLKPTKRETTGCISGICILSHVLMFVMGLIASYSASALITHGSASQSTAIMPHGNSITPSRASATAIIDGVEVLGTQCGKSWQEAKAMGCHYDMMASRWYAPDCFDKEVLDDMLSETHVNFTWYADRAHTIVVPTENVLKGEFDKVYPDNLFHLKHCLHLWRRLHHAVLTGRSLDEDILEYHHTVHCTKMIMDWTSPGFERQSVSISKPGRPFCRASKLGLITIKN